MRRGFYLCLGLWLAACGGLEGQDLIVGSGPAGALPLTNSDLAVLEAREPREDLPCRVRPLDPGLGFDLRFHSIYQVSVPLEELAGTNNWLTITFRVIPEEPGGEAVHFVQRVRVPAIEEGAKGDAVLRGVFDVGLGRYRVDWLMRDRRGRVCSDFWEVEAELPGRDRDMVLAIAPGAVQATEVEQFQPEAPVARDPGPLHVKVLVNFAPQDTDSSSMRPLDTSALVSVLRRIAREPEISTYSLVVFNLQEQRVLHRQDNVGQIDFPAVGRALDSLSLGTVDVSQLMQKHGETRFLEELVRQEMPGPEGADALVFVGPKAMLDENVSEELLREIGQPDVPVFYLNCNLEPHRRPWRDAIGRVVRFFKGSELLVSRPRDVWFAVREVVSRIAGVRRGEHDSDSFVPPGGADR